MILRKLNRDRLITLLLLLPSVVAVAVFSMAP